MKLLVEIFGENWWRGREEHMELTFTASSHVPDALLSSLPVRVYSILTGA